MYSIDLTDKVAIVTGGNKGIGRSITETLLDAGAHVFIFARDIGAALQELIAEYGEQRVAGINGNVKEQSSIVELFEATMNKFGRLDILVNNAATSTMDYVVNIKEEDWDHVMDVNAKGVFLCSQLAARRMLKQDSKSKIINISSQAGKNGYRGMGNYVASKHAVLGFTKTMAVELASSNVTVNAVCPGIVETEMKHRERVEGAKVRGMTAAEIEAEDNSQVPMGRTAQPVDIAKVVLFLASDLSDYMTGQAINVTGGMTMN